MIKEKYKKMLIISFVLVLSIISIITTIISGEQLHNENCDIHNCIICDLRSISKDIMKSMGLMSINIFILMIIILTIQLIDKNSKNERTLTLVEAKVVQNK